MDKAVVERALRALAEIGAVRAAVEELPREMPESTDAAPATATATVAQPCWPPESLDADRRFGQPHARLFPFLGRKVRTPRGPGNLLQVFAECVTVLLDSDRDGACARFLPAEISPVAAEEPYA